MDTDEIVGDEVEHEVGADGSDAAMPSPGTARVGKQCRLADVVTIKVYFAMSALGQFETNECCRRNVCSDPENGKVEAGLRTMLMGQQWVGFGVDVARPPDTHVVFFDGDYPRGADGSLHRPQPRSRKSRHIVPS